MVVPSDVTASEDMSPPAIEVAPVTLTPFVAS
jgi:hypothetical protein